MAQITSMNFDLPNNLIAQRPVSPRDHARLLIYNRADGSITDDHFYNLGKYLNADTALVVNNSKVEKCRLKFGTDEVFVTETINPTTFKALVRPGRKFRADKIYKHGVIELVTTDVLDDGQRILRSNFSIDDKSYDKYRLTPLPPYIKQDESLSDEYQTVYAEPLGSKASPTAGLHFTKNQLSELSKKHPIAHITLHVGLGTFKSPTPDQIKNLKLHEEEFFISAESADRLNSAQHITAVGTTSLRSLESAGKPFKEINAKTDIFITLGYEFSAVDSLITNFHLPGTSLLMLVSAFVGSEKEAQKIYNHAINGSYRFYSFGDAMLIL